MKNWKKHTSLLLALIMCLSMAACGGKVSIEDLEGFWYPLEGLGSDLYLSRWGGRNLGGI